MSPRRQQGYTSDSDVPPADWRNHPEGFEDGWLEEWEGEPDNGGYDRAESFD